MALNTKKAANNIGGFLSKYWWLILIAVGAIMFFPTLFDTIKSMMTNFASLFGGKTEDQKKIHNVQAQAGNAFDSNYWKQNGNVHFKEETAKKLAKQIYDSKHYTGANFDELFAAIKQCPTKTDVSWIAYNFYRVYAQDMLSYIVGSKGILNKLSTWLFNSDSQFTDDNVLTLTEYVNSLPNS